MIFPEIEDEKIEEILELFGKKKLKEVKKYAKNMVLWQNEFVALILMARNGLDHYKYAVHYWEEQPEHLQLSEEEKKAFSENGVGPLKGKAKKALSKTMQMFVQRKWVVGHLFYTANFKIWHLFYFDLKDVSDQNNHWVGRVLFKLKKYWW